MLGQEHFIFSFKSLGFYSKVKSSQVFIFSPVERATVPGAGPRAEQVEEGAAVVWQWGALQQQPRHHSEVVSVT